MALKLKKRAALDPVEIQRLFLKNQAEYEQHLLDRARFEAAQRKLSEVRLRISSTAPNSKGTSRSILHFSEKYGNGKLSVGFTEFLIRRGYTVDDDVLWLKHPLNLKSRGLSLKKR